MDEMRRYEVPYLARNCGVSVKQNWLMTRQMMWASIQPQITKKIDVDDVMKFNFEDDDYVPQQKPYEPTTDEIYNYLYSVNGEEKKEFTAYGSKGEQ